MLSGYGVTAENYNNNHRANVKRNVIELARTWPLYFSRLFPVSGAAQVSILYVEIFQIQENHPNRARAGWYINFIILIVVTAF